MSILIKGMEMPPKGDYYITLYVCSDGSAYVDVSSFPAGKDTFEAVPAADVRPVVRGKWEHGREIARTMLGNETLAIEYEDWHCSACGAVVEDYEFPRYKFCPNCGADMRQRGDENV